MIGELAADWENEIRYEVLMRVPGVRSAVERAAKAAPKIESAEEFLKSCDWFATAGAPMEMVGRVGNALGESMGVKTGKRRAERIAAPSGRVMLRVLCSLARHGQKLQGVKQERDTCTLEAVLPSDMWAFEGTLTVTVRSAGRARMDSADEGAAGDGPRYSMEATVTDVEAGTNIPGQMFDWGKSKRCLKRLFEDLKRDPA